MNVVDQLWHGAADGPALITADGVRTRGDLRARVERWRGGLVAAGIGHGDRVVLVSGNDECFIAAYLALLGLGAVTVPLNPQSPAAELRREAAAVAPAAVIVGPGLPSADGVVAPHDVVGPDVLVLDPEQLDSAAPHPSQEVAPDDTALLLFTSGTAGMPKPAVLTHRNLDAALASMTALPVELIGAGHVALAVIPLFHVFGLSTIINLGLRIGATLVLHEYQSAGAMAEAVAEHQVTLIVGPPTMWQLLVTTEGLDRAMFASVRLAISGAAKLDPALHARVDERLGIELFEGYGLTETCAVAASAVGSKASVGSVGHLMPGVEARVVDGSGDDVLIGDPGEVWLRGPMVSPGYLHVDDDGLGHVTSNRDEDGWLRTGDIAVVDDDGTLSIVDRAKDLVIVSGFNVYPAEVEAVLLAHPSIADAAVVGEADSATGEALIAHVVVAPRAELETQDLIDHCRLHLARYKVPHRVERHSLLPRGPGGKMRRKDLPRTPETL